MKLAVNFNDSLKTICQDKDKLLGCYFISLDQDFNPKKLVQKSIWQQLKDENDNLLWENSELLKPVMGYVVTGENIEIGLEHLDLWALKEVLDEKYKQRLKKTNYSHIFYNEFIDDSLDCLTISGLSFGKKICSGTGTIIHNLKFKDKNFKFECEYEQMPKLEVSLNNKAYYPVTEIPFEKDARVNPESFTLKLTESSLLAYSVCFNSDEIYDFKDYFGINVISKQ